MNEMLFKSFRINDLALEVYYPFGEGNENTTEDKSSNCHNIIFINFLKYISSLSECILINGYIAVVWDSHFISFDGSHYTFKVNEDELHNLVSDPIVINAIFHTEFIQWSKSKKYGTNSQ